MAQLTQKTNQFNLTTKRYLESDIQHFVEDINSLVIAFSVTDKFGDNGITGLCILFMDYLNKCAEIDTFLMSCRIIGRNIEYSFIDFLIQRLKSLNYQTVTATYFQTLKNDQVCDF